MNKSIFETLRELETDDLRFPEVEQSDSDLRIEATSFLKRGDIDVRIREKLSGIHVLENMRCKSSQDPPPTCFGGPWSEAEIEYWRKVPRHTYYTFRYDIAAVLPSEWKPSDEVPDKHVGITLTSFDGQRCADMVADIAANPTGLGKEGSVFAKMVLADHGVHGVLNESKPQSSCSECKGTGYYTPLVGPREPCKTCQGKPIMGQPTSLVRDFKINVLSQLQPFEIPGITITPCALVNVLPSSFSERILDSELGGIVWGPKRFANDFVTGLRVKLLSMLGSKTTLKFYFDISSIRIEYDNVSCCHRMFILFWVEIA